MTGTHRLIRTVAEVRYLGGQNVVVLCNAHGGDIKVQSVGTNRAEFVAQQLRKDLQERINLEVMMENAKAGTLVEQPYRVECLFLGGVA